MIYFKKGVEKEEAKNLSKEANRCRYVGLRQDGAEEEKAKCSALWWWLWGLLFY